MTLRRGAARRAGAPATGRAAVAVLGAAALAAGCGDDAPSEPAATAATTAAAGSSAPVTIARPADGSRLRATRTPAGRLRVRTRVRGGTRPGGEVFLSASCRPLRCDAHATAGGDGTWAVTMTLATNAGARFVTIDASSRAAVAATGSAVTTVELAVPATEPGVTGTGSKTAPGGAATPPRPPIAQRSPALPHDVLVIGDSLAVGMADALRASLPGWRVSVEAKISRPLATGMQILAGRSAAPAILAFSLFTNDDPGATVALSGP